MKIQDYTFCTVYKLLRIRIGKLSDKILQILQWGFAKWNVKDYYITLLFWIQHCYKTKTWKLKSRVLGIGESNNLKPETSYYYI